VLFAENILTIKAFDAKGGYYENYNPRRSRGSNYYKDSNIRQWLNSTSPNRGKELIDWIQNDPIAANLWSGNDPYIPGEGDNPYNSEKGFLANGNFTATERTLIVPYTHRVTLVGFDFTKREGGTEELTYSAEFKKVVQNYDTTAYYQNVTDNVFLLSVKQVKEWVFDRGWEYRAKPTAQAVSNSTFKTDGLNTDEFWCYWLNTPYTHHGDWVRQIWDKTYIYNYGDAFYGRVGVRPALLFDVSAAAFSPGGEGSLDRPFVVDRGPVDVPTDEPEIVPPPLEENPKLVGKPTLAVVGKEIYLNKKRLNLGTSVPATVKNSILVPFRAIFSELGMSVKWNGNTKTVDANNALYSMRLKLNSHVVIITEGSNERVIMMPVPMTTIRGVTMVPLRFVAEQSGLEVTYRKQ
jgi:hypothetical protein